MKSIYIAGPTVFKPDAEKIYKTWSSMVRECGFEPLCPIDNQHTDPSDISFWNKEMIKACDYVIAEITPFRGPSCDVGTAFEIGYAEALGKPVILWSKARSEYCNRVEEDGMMIEDFGLEDNLMITSESCVFGNFYSALIALIALIKLESNQRN